MKKILLIIGVSILLFVLGLLLTKPFRDLSLALLNLDENNYPVTILQLGFLKNISLALALSSIPGLFFIVKKFAKLKTHKQSFITSGIIIFSGIFTWLFRIFQLKMGIPYSNLFSLEVLR